MDITPAGAADRADIERLLDTAFGPNRQARTAYRLREGIAPYPDLSMVIRDRGQLVGSIQYWPIELACPATGQGHALTLLGPVAVATGRQGEGIGQRLIQTSLDVADSSGHDAIVLIGDADYYGRFGFTAAATGGWNLPGPFDRHRLLARLVGGVRLPSHGLLRVARGLLSASKAA